MDDDNVVVAILDGAITLVVVCLVASAALLITL